MTALFRFSDHTIITDVGMVILRPAEATILGVLAKHHNRVVSFETIANSLWPLGSDDVIVNEHNQIATNITHLRPKLEPLGLHIKNIPGVGYYLEGELDVDWTAI